MDKTELIKLLKSIQEDAYWSSGISYEDTLQDALKSLSEELLSLIIELEKD